MYVAETCSRLAKRLEPASPDELAAFVVTLQEQFPSQDVADDALRRRQQGYLLSLDGVPAFALEEAFRRIMQRRVPGFSPKFMPTGPELRDLLDQISSTAREFRGSLHRLLNARVDDPPRRDGPRELPVEVVKLLTPAEGERRRSRHRPNPVGVNHSIPYPLVKGE